MRFSVPQFIERESKIIGPLTFKQFLYVGFAATILFVLYFAIPFILFTILAVAITGGALLLAFLRVGGRSLPIVAQNFLTFFASSKIYLWKKKEIPPKFIKLGKMPQEEKTEEGPSLKIAERSRLKGLSTEIETGIR